MAAINCDVTFFSCLMLSLLVRCFQCEPFQVPSYTIDLDLPPEERWVNVSKTFMKYAPQIAADIRNKIPQEVMFLAELIALHLEKHLPDPYPSEIKGVAKGLNLSVIDALLLNLMYDMTAYCTSIVAEDKQGNIFHGRNLDYGFSDTLRNITFMSNFKSKGKEPETSYDSHMFCVLLISSKVSSRGMAEDYRSSLMQKRNFNFQSLTL